MAEARDDIIDQKGAFAQKFIGGTTNPAQRKRYQDDIAAAEEMQFEREDEARAFRFENDPNFARSVNARDRLLLDRETRMRDDILAEKRFMLDSRIRDEGLKIQQGKAELDMDRIGLDIEKKKAGLEDAKRITDDTASLQRGERQLRYGMKFPGDPEYAKGAMDLLLNHPYAEPALRKSLVDAMRVDMDPDEFVFELKEMKANGLEPRISVTTDEFGKKKRTLTGVPRKDSDPAALNEKRFGEAQIRYDKAIDNLKAIGSEIKETDDGLNEDRAMLRELAADARSELKRLRGERAKSLSGGGTNPEAVPPAGGTAPPAAGVSAAAPAQAASGPAVGVVEGGFRFKGGNPADRNNWEPVK